MDKKLFGTRINKARKDRGLTAEKLAEACNINSTYLRQIEGGKKLPSLPVFATLCRELRVSPNYILPDLVEGTEAEKIQKIFSESDPTPSQIEMLAEMAGVILKERYKVGVPLRTQGWICSKLANVTIKDGRCDGLQYYKAKGAACSQRFFDCMNELVQKVIQEEAK